MTPFVDRVCAFEALPKTILQAFGIDDEEHARTVYDGRRVRAAQQGLDVVILDEETIPRGAGGCSDQHEHRLILRVTLATLGQGDRSGKNQLTEMRAKVRALVAALDSQRPWLDVIGPEVLETTAELRSIDETPESTNKIRGVVALSVLTRGTGDLDDLESPGG